MGQALASAAREIALESKGPGRVTVTQTHEGREEKGKVKILLTPKSKSTETGGSQEEGGGILIWQHPA